MVTFNRYHLIISLLKLMIIKKKLGHIPSELFSNKPGTADGKSLDLAQDGRPWRLMGVGLLSYVTFEEVLFKTNPMITKITGNTSENTRLALLRKFRRIHIFTMALNWRLERFSVCFSRSSKSVSMVTWVWQVSPTVSGLTLLWGKCPFSSSMAGSVRSLSFLDTSSSSGN